jgi:hypothetical protein
MRVEMSAQAAEFISARGGRLWVWTARPQFCCNATPAYMHAATEQPRGLSGFAHLAETEPMGVEILFRPPAGRLPDFLEIDLRGRRRPRVEAYWEGCVMAL